MSDSEEEDINLFIFERDREMHKWRLLHFITEKFAEITNHTKKSRITLENIENELTKRIAVFELEVYEEEIYRYFFYCKFHYERTKKKI